MFKNLDKIHPIKRKELLQWLEALHELNLKNKVIDKVIVFGSSTRNDCTKKSDIDICFISDYPIRTIEYYFRIFLQYKKLYRFNRLQTC